MKERPPLTDRDEWPFKRNKGQPLGAIDIDDLEWARDLKKQDLDRWDDYIRRRKAEAAAAAQHVTPPGDDEVPF